MKKRYVFASALTAVALAGGAALALHKDSAEAATKPAASSTWSEDVGVDVRPPPCVGNATNDGPTAKKFAGYGFDSIDMKFVRGGEQTLTIHGVVQSEDPGDPTAADYYSAWLSGQWLSGYWAPKITSTPPKDRKADVTITWTWAPNKPFCVQASDGETDLYTFSAFDPFVIDPAAAPVQTFTFKGRK